MNKTISQNFENKKKKMFKSKVTAKSIIHSHFFHSFISKIPHKFRQETATDMISETIYQTFFIHAKFHLVLPRNKS